MIQKKTAFSYDDVLLVPQYSDIRSRSDIDISINMGKGLKLGLPIFSSPMDTISEKAMAEKLSESGACAIVHRYNTIEKQATLVGEALAHSPGTIVGAAVGISGNFLNRAAILKAIGVNLICVDVAHGHHVLMKEALQTLRTALGDEIHIMAGNVATLEGVNDLADWGANSVRCNIGGGSICSTRVQTGHGMPGLQTIFECAKTDRDVAIVADGGIRNSGDMVKALAAGADAVMVGSLIAGTDETPGNILQDKDGHKWKVYRGMASKEAQIDWRGKYSSFEGVAATVPYRGPVQEIIKDLERGIRSGLSYSGCKNIKELQSRAQFVIQTPSGISESAPHIMGRKW
jgi:IMP dehydrogenase